MFTLYRRETEAERSGCGHTGLGPGATASHAGLGCEWVGHCSLEAGVEPYPAGLASSPGWGSDGTRPVAKCTGCPRASLFHSEIKAKQAGSCLCQGRVAKCMQGSRFLAKWIPPQANGSFLQEAAWRSPLSFVAFLVTAVVHPPSLYSSCTILFPPPPGSPL